MEKLQLDKEIRNPVLDISSSMTLEYKTPPETVITQPSNRDIAEKVNEIIDFINFIGQRDGNDSYLAEFNQSRATPTSHNH